MATLIWRGDAQGRAQVTKLTPANVEVGDVFTVTCNRKDISVTATAATVANVCALLVAAINAAIEAGTIPELDGVTASTYVDDDGVAIAVKLTGKDDGTPFTVTTSTTEGGIGIDIEETVAGDAGQNEVQRITLPGTPTGGTFTLTFDGDTTGNLTYDESAADIQTELEGLAGIGAGNVAVSGSNGGPWNVTFQGDLANTDVSLMTGDGSSLTYGAGAHSVQVTTLQQGGGGLNEVQRVSYRATSGTFTLTFNGVTTGAIAYNAAAADVVTALEALSNIGVGDVAVTRTVSGSTYTFNITFQGAYRFTDVPLLVGNGASLDGGQSIDVVESVAGAPGANEVFIIQRPTTVDATFQVLFPGSGTGQPVTITAATTTPAQLEALINNAAAAAGISGPVCLAWNTNANPHGVNQSSWSNLFLVEFIGPLASTDFHLYGPFVTPTSAPYLRSIHPSLRFTDIQDGDPTGANETQIISIGGGATGGTFTLTFEGQTTGNLTFDESAADIETALEALSTIDSVTVTGNAGGPWTVEFTGVDGSTDQPMISGDATNLTGATVNVNVTQASNAGTNETQRVTLGGSPAGGTFTLSFEGDTTGNLDFDATADEVRAELEALATLGAGTVSVTGSDRGPWDVTFQGSRGGENVPAMTGDGSLLSGGSVDISTIQEAVEQTPEQQTVTINQATGGTFTLTFDGDTTAAIAYSATAGTVQTSLEQLASIGAGNVLVSGNAGGPYLVEFIGTLLGSDVDLMTADDSGLTGAGSQSLTKTEDITPTGPNWVNEPENWSTGNNPVNGDIVIIENNAVDMLWGLDQLSSVTLAERHTRASYTGKRGLTQVHEDGFYEYRPAYWQIGVTKDFIGEGDGPGSSRLKDDYGSVQTEAIVYRTGQPEDGNIPAVLLKGTHTSNVIRVFRGSVGVAFLAGETSALSRIQVGYLLDRDSDAEVVCGAGCDLDDIDISGGELLVNLYAAGAGDIICSGGELTINGDEAVDTLKVSGDGYVYYNTTGALGGNPVLADDATLDFSQDMRAKTVTNPIEIQSADARVLDPWQVVAGLVLDLNHVAADLNGSTIGTNVRLTRGTPA